MFYIKDIDQYEDYDGTYIIHITVGQLCHIKHNVLRRSYIHVIHLLMHDVRVLLHTRLQIMSNGLSVADPGFEVTGGGGGALFFRIAPPLERFSWSHYTSLYLDFFRISNCTPPPPLELFSWSHTPYGIRGGGAHSRHNVLKGGGGWGTPPPWIRPWLYNGPQYTLSVSTYNGLQYTLPHVHASE